MSKIYLVTSGSYFDFGVVAAYSKQEDAEQAVANGLGDSWEECPPEVASGEVFAITKEDIINDGFTTTGEK